MLIDTIKSFAESIPASWSEKRGVFTIQFIVAERKTFLSKKKLTYTAKFRIDDAAKEIRFTEQLKESGAGVSGGGGGMGFKTETYNTRKGPREGSIEEQSRLFGAKYSYTFDFSKVRAFLESEAANAGFTFDYKLTSRGV
jgi:hypothetical protein